MLQLLCDGLACWRISHMLVKENGPFDLFISLRELSGIRHDSDGIADSWNEGNPLVCVLCTSMWVAIVMMLVPKRIKRVCAVSGIASLMELWNGKS